MVAFMSKAKPKRWFKFAVCALLVVIAVVGIFLGLYGRRMYQARKQRAAVEVIKRHGGDVSYDHNWDQKGSWIGGSQPPGPAWQRKLLGKDFVSDVNTVWVCNSNFGDDDIACLADLPELFEVEIYRSPVTDAGLEHLEGLTNLKTLYLRKTLITDDGLERLKTLTNLEELMLDHSQITDAGLEHIKEFTNLKKLWLGETQITDAGLEHLQELSNLEQMCLERTQITDAGLEHLKALPNLGYLDVSDTQVTDDGIKSMKLASPKSIIRVLPRPVGARP